MRFPESGVETGADAVPDWGWLADGKTAYSMPVRVTAGGIGVSGIEVLFTMSEGEGAVLSAPSAVTDKNGIAQAFITASKPGAYVLDAVISDKHRDREDLLVSFIRRDKPILQFTAGSAYYTVDGVAQSAVAPAFVRDGRAYLSVRDMGKALGAMIEWDQESQAATLTNSAAVVRIPVGATTIYANQRGARSDIAVDAPAVNEKGRVYLPFRAVLELFGYQVSYDQEKQEITCI
ncbi:MAG: stalk domain-containing protein [Clostridiales bacterium]|nr:stalk domain-containing protein [Clostridiales bacterium]